MFELNTETRWILGRPNFACFQIAVMLRQKGVLIPTKAEEEQAHVIHWLLTHYEADPENWRQNAEEELRRSTEIRNPKS